MTARRGGDAPLRACHRVTCSCTGAAHPTSKLSVGGFIEGYLGILIIYIRVNHMEDFILQNHKPKTLRKYPKTSTKVQLKESTWLGVFVSKFFIKVKNYHPLGLPFYP